MAFIAECPFCRIKLQKVPDHREGDSTECPRCHNLFTLAAMISPPKLRTSSTTIVPLKTAPAPAASASAPAAVASPAHGTVTVQADPTEPKTPAVPAGKPSRTVPQAETRVVVVAPARRSMLTHPQEARVLGVVALFLSSVALCTATLLHLFWITVGVGGAAALCAVIALAAGPKTRGVAKMPLYALLLSLAVVGLTTVWSSLLGFETPVARDLTEGTGKITVLPRADKSKTTRAAVEQLPWVDATDSSIEHDGIRVQIASAVLQPVETTDAKGKKSTREKNLLLKIRITSIGATTAHEYTSWGEPGPDAAILKDSQNRAY
ncbi:MAG TPA: hypothetical protein VGY58_05380, partial [Gemmataceae bacterium]|nr:hypothetical protein [Gemmataceae bacterium]